MKNNTPLEAKEQEAVFEWAQAMGAVHHELKLLYAIPNGGSRHRLEAVNLKRQGVKAGVPDMCLPVARGDQHGLYIELKRSVGGRIQPEQLAWMDALAAQGYHCAVCMGADHAIKVIAGYLGIRV